MQFSLFFFANETPVEPGGRRYRLLLESARLADERGLAAVWTPERHFHPFGGLYPNPAVTAAALAAVTSRIRIRAGSVVAPLHHAIRIAEEWSVVDNLSDGRVDVSFASGWQPVDFALAPDRYERRKEITTEALRTVRALWAGEEVDAVDGTGAPVRLRLFPPPVQPRLPVWVTSAGNPETFALAGSLRANLLTHLLGQTPETVAAKIGAYRDARAEAGDGEAGHVTLMLHAFLGEDVDEVREIVRGPFSRYLRSSFDLMAGWAAKLGWELDPKTVSESEIDFLVARAFDRYFERSGLFGTVESARGLVRELDALGVDEVACLVDFGPPIEETMRSLELIAALAAESTPAATASGGAPL